MGPHHSKEFIRQSRVRMMIHGSDQKNWTSPFGRLSETPSRLPETVFYTRSSSRTQRLQDPESRGFKSRSTSFRASIILASLPMMPSKLQEECMRLLRGIHIESDHIFIRIDALGEGRCRPRIIDARKDEGSVQSEVRVRTERHR
jgi:hypothetical protein